MSGSKVPDSVRQRIRESAQDRCGYCLCPQRVVPITFEIDHLIPRSKGGSDDESNLWLSCPLCNRYKGAQITAVDPESGETVALFNPRTQNWKEHFQWAQKGTHIAGRTPTGRATVAALRLNNEIAVEVRRNWISAGWHPPDLL